MLKKKDIVYYARIIPNSGIYDVCELIIRTVAEDYFVGIDKVDKHAYLFPYASINNIVFRDRKLALNKVKMAELNKKEINNETYYEEYQEEKNMKLKNTWNKKCNENKGLKPSKNEIRFGKCIKKLDKNNTKKQDGCIWILQKHLNWQTIYRNMI